MMSLAETEQAIKKANSLYFAEMRGISLEEKTRRADISAKTAILLIELFNRMYGEARKSLEDFMQNYGDFSDELNVIYNQSAEKSLQTPSLVSMSFEAVQKQQFMQILPSTLKRVEKAYSFTDAAAIIAALSAMSYAFSAKRAVSAARNNTNSLCNCDVLAQLREQGYTRKRWNTVMDGRERDTHARVNSTVVGIDETFTVGGYRMMFPRDTSYGAPPSEIINCRCTISGI